MKSCSKYKEEKSTIFFGKLKSAKDGLRHTCKQCTNEEFSRYRKENPDRRKAGDRKYRENNRDKAKILSRKHYLKNKEKINKRHSEWEINNNGVRRAIKAKRRAAKLNATLPGYNAEIKEIYMNCPKGYHVDHIVPLQGKIVCGLHVPWNLQHLTAEENLRKSNKLIKELLC